MLLSRISTNSLHERNRKNPRTQKILWCDGIFPWKEQKAQNFSCCINQLAGSCISLSLVCVFDVPFNSSVQLSR